MSDEHTIHTYDTKPHLTVVEDPTNDFDMSSLDDEQADELGDFIRGGLMFLDILGKQAEQDEKIRGFTPTQGGVVFEHEPVPYEPIDTRVYQPTAFTPTKRNSKGQFVKKETP